VKPIIHGCKYAFKWETCYIWFRRKVKIFLTEKVLLLFPKIIKFLYFCYISLRMESLMMIREPFFPLFVSYLLLISATWGSHNFLHMILSPSCLAASSVFSHDQRGVLKRTLTPLDPRHSLPNTVSSLINKKQITIPSCARDPPTKSFQGPLEKILNSETHKKPMRNLRRSDRFYSGTNILIQHWRIAGRRTHTWDTNA